MVPSNASPHRDKPVVLGVMRISGEGARKLAANENPGSTEPAAWRQQHKMRNEESASATKPPHSLSLQRGQMHALGPCRGRVGRRRGRTVIKSVRHGANGTRRWTRVPQQARRVRSTEVTSRLWPSPIEGRRSASRPAAILPMMAGAGDSGARVTPVPGHAAAQEVPPCTPASRHRGPGPEVDRGEPPPPAPDPRLRFRI